MQNKNKKPRFQSSLHEMDHQRKKTQRSSWMVLGLFFFTALFVQQNTQIFQTALLQIPQHAPFDGTALPIKNSPDWVRLTSTEYKLSYDQIPGNKMLSLPLYDSGVLARSTDGLSWSDSTANGIRNAKITFPVPYMGSYRLNGREYDGSHLAVDIKIPERTPVYSIANGVVVKVANLSSGFGKHIVVQHNGVPTLNDPSARTTLFSAYDHLSSISVVENQVLRKGELVGYSGSTGFATTPHLHFQIDTDEAPWHPYWPFTGKESSDAGLDFVGAVNAGLGKERALLTSVSPMMYVQKYLNFSPSLPVAPTPNSTPEPSVSATPPVIPAPEVPSSGLPFDRFELQNASSFEKTGPATIQIFAKDQSGNAVSAFDGDVLMLLTGNVGVLPKASLNRSDFSTGSATVTLQELRAGTGQLILLYQGKQFVSPSFVVRDAVPEVTHPAAPETQSPQNPPTVSVDFSSKKDLFADVRGSHPYYEAISYLKQNQIVKGYPDGTFQPNKKVTRAEALKILFEGSKRPTTTLIQNPPKFTDIKYNQWYGKYVYAAYKANIAQGYPDKTFRPNQNVTRSEFLKMLLTAMLIPLNPIVSENPYSDVTTSDWFAPYVAYAKEKNILPENSLNFGPNDEVSRDEVAETLYRLMIVRETNAVAYSDSLVQ
ncbi:MAG: S-layer homology domain-containing protein [Patescibacteria group bacterium]